MDDLYFTGSIIPWVTNRLPRGWYFCDGRRMNPAQWSALFSIIGYRYGRDGNDFFLPNLNGRVAVGAASTTAVSGGTENVALTASEIPNHSHYIRTNTNFTTTGSSQPDSNKVPGVSKAGIAATQLYKQYSSSTDFVALHPATLSPLNGLGNAHTNLQPYTTFWYIICVDGLYPVRQ